jgi:hypothetical protein
MRHSVLLYASLILVVALGAVTHAEVPTTASLVPVSGDLIELELAIDGRTVGTVAVLDGSFIRVAGESRTFAISPVHVGGGEFDIVVLEISRNPTDQESLRHLETISGAYYGTDIELTEAPISVQIMNLEKASDSYAKMPISCDRCCIYCNGMKVCACAVTTSCGQCCCSDCC